jgi:hypothetical protein
MDVYGATVTVSLMFPEMILYVTLAWKNVELTTP